MSQMPNIPIPEDDDSQQSRHHQKRKNKSSSKKNCLRLCMIVMCIVLLLMVSMKFTKQQETVYVKECEVYDCTIEVKAIGKKSESSGVDMKKLGQKQQQKIGRWQLQKILWIYKSENEQKQSAQRQLFGKLNNENTKYFANLSGYEIREFTLSNYTGYLSEQSITKINLVKSSLKKLKQSQETHKQTLAQIKHNELIIEKRLITYMLLLQHGGVFIEDGVTIVERFETWLQEINGLQYINVGDKMNSRRIKPKCFGFFDNDYSSLRLKANVMREYEFERKVVAFPALEEGFLACEKLSEFLVKLINTYVELIVDGKSFTKWQLLNKSQRMIGKTNPQLLYQDGHLLASHIVLQQRQKELLRNPNEIVEQALQDPTTPSTSQPNDSNFITLAIDSFGLITINNNLGPHKFRHIFLYQEKCYSYLTKLSVQEMVQTMGKVRFITKLTPYVKWKLGKHLIEGSTKEIYFVSKSFVFQYFLRFLPNDLQELQAKYALKSGPQIMNYHTSPQQNINNPLWNTLPNTLWVIWDKGLKRHSKPIIELCYQNLKKSAQASNFSINVISNNNIEQFISKKLRDQIMQTIKNANQPISSQTISDFWRLAIMYQNGGVYVDASTFTTGQNFDWIRNVTRISSDMLWNRYGTEPEVFIFWNTLLGCPANWHYDLKHNTKVQWHLSYESNFIAAIKHSEFVREWLEVFMLWITLPYDQILEQMSNVGMQDSKWTKAKDRYLLVMDAVKYVVGRRQKQQRQSLNPAHQSAADYYKIWSLPGQMIGQQKFRGQYNFESRDYRLDYMDQQILNLYKTEYEWKYAEELLGSLDYQTKFFGLDLRESGFLLDNFYRDNAQNFTLQRFEQIIHPESVFGKLLFFRDRQFTVKLMRYYNEMAVTRLELKTVKMAGL